MSERNAVGSMRAYNRGDEVAWTEKTFGHTSGVSEVHRAFQDGRTYCLLELPDAEHHFDILPNMPRCHRCEALFDRNATFKEVIAA